MTAVLRVEEPSARYIVQGEPALIRGFELVAAAHGGVAALRESILSLALRGRIVAQVSTDEPAALLIRRIANANGREHPKPVDAILPIGWVRVSFGDYASRLNTGPFGSLIGKDDYVDGGVPLVNPSHMRNGRIAAETGVAVSPDKANELAPYALATGDIVFARRGEVGRTALVTENEDGWLCGTGSFFARFEPEVDRAFVQLIFDSVAMRRYLAGEAVGVTMVNLNQRMLRSAALDIPPLAEQHRIVARVEELMRLCDALEQSGRLADEQHARLTSTLFDALAASESAHALAENWQRIAEHFDLLLDRPEAIDALEQTILQLAVRGLLVPHALAEASAHQLYRDVIGKRKALHGNAASAVVDFHLSVASDEEPYPLHDSWLWVRIEDICDVQGGIQKTQLRRPIKNHFPYLRVANVQRDRLSLDRIERYELTDDEVERWALKAGDLLVVEGNGSADEVGRCAMWDGAISPCVFQNHLMRVRPDVGEMVGFLKLFLNSPVGAAEMKRLAVTTSGLYNLSVGKIRKIPVPLPPLAEQHRIVARVEELRRLCAQLRERLTAARLIQSNLADALVSEAVA